MSGLGAVKRWCPLCTPMAVVRGKTIKGTSCASTRASCPDCESLTDAVAGRVGVVGEAEFVVLVVSYATPEADGVNHCRRRTPFSLAQQVGLMRVDEYGLRQYRNVIERIVLVTERPKKPSLKMYEAPTEPPLLCAAELG